MQTEKDEDHQHWALVRLPSGEKLKIFLTDEEHEMTTRGILTHVSINEDGTPKSLEKTPALRERLPELDERHVLRSE
jgi:hypothetical protein